MATPIRLGSTVIDMPVLLAPMAGTTDYPFRRQAQAFGAPYVVSEMVAGDQLARSRRDVVRRTAGAGVVTPLVIQLAGRESRWMAEGARLAEDAGADVIDINMGCPSKLVTNGASGSALMRDPNHALRLIEATVGGTSKPVTLKMRLGWDDENLNAPEIARRAESAGVQMIVVHGRTRSQFFRGDANWSAIRPTVDAVDIPVIANGDIATVDDARRALEESGAAGVMVGRAAQGRPWLPGAIALGLRDGHAATSPGLGDIHASLDALYRDSLSFYGVDLGARIARKHISWAIDAEAIFLNDQDRRTARAEVCRMTSPDEVCAALARIFIDADWREAA
ncbi:MAG: tRNA dihydrouridine synthase DusB [Alphaproteobacteria bacterium]|nr:tRNA dihydrouridine synthase DusB [Alphaproteobacteria bacterium]